LLTLLIISFAIWGVGDMTRVSGRNSAVATVGGSTITQEAFGRALKVETENLRQMLGERYSPELMKTIHPERRVLGSLINQKLLAQESESLGLIPGDADVARTIRNNP